MLWPNLQLQFQQTNSPWSQPTDFYKEKRLLNSCSFGGGGTKIKMYDPLAGTGVRDLYKQLNAMVSPQIGQGITPYAGQTVAGVSPLQQMGFGLATGLAPLVSGPQEYFQNVLTQQQAGGYPIQQLAGRTLEGLMQPYDYAGARDYWQQAFVNPAMQTWRETVAPQIAEQYGAGGVGGAWGEQLGRSGTNLMTNLSGQLANILYSGEQAQLGRQMQGMYPAIALSQLPGEIIGQAGQVGGQGTNALAQLLGMGAQQRGITQEQLGGQYQTWQQAQPWANPYLANYLGMALSQPGMQYYGVPKEAGIGSQILGPLGSFLGQSGMGAELGQGFAGMLGSMGLSGSAAAAAGPLEAVISAGQGAIEFLPMLLAAFSDKRLKRNFSKIKNAISKIKRLEGLTFDLITNGNKSAGLIAQDVEKVLPESVAEKYGYKYINYIGIIALLINAIKELNEKVEAIKNG